LSKFAYFSNTRHHTTFQNPTLDDSSVTLTSDVNRTAKLVLLMAGNYKLEGVGHLFIMTWYSQPVTLKWVKW